MYDQTANMDKNPTNQGIHVKYFPTWNSTIRPTVRPETLI